MRFSFLNMILVMLFTVFLLISHTQQGSELKLSLQKLLDATNLARTEPQKMMEFIKEEWYNHLNSTSGKCKVTTWRLRLNEECPKQFDDLFAFYKNQKPVEPLKLSKGLTVGAYNHAKYMATEVHKLTHDHGDETLTQRYKVYTDKDIGFAAENILYELKFFSRSEKHQIARFALDDGTTSRGHRKNLYGIGYKYVGFGVVKDPTNDRLYLSMGFSQMHDCSKCDQIPESVEKAMGWDTVSGNTQIPEDEKGPFLKFLLGLEGNSIQSKSLLFSITFVFGLMILFLK